MVQTYSVIEMTMTSTCIFLRILCFVSIDENSVSTFAAIRTSCSIILQHFLVLNILRGLSKFLSFSWKILILWLFQEQTQNSLKKSFLSLAL